MGERDWFVAPLIYDSIFPLILTLGHSHWLLETGEWREKDIHWLPLVCAPTSYQTCNLGMCPDRELNLQSFDARDLTPTNWATQARAIGWFSYVTWLGRELAVLANGDDTLTVTPQCFSNINAELNQVGSYKNIEILILYGAVRPKILPSTKLSGNADTTGLWTTLRAAKVSISPLPLHCNSGWI